MSNPTGETNVPIGDWTTGTLKVYEDEKISLVKEYVDSRIDAQVAKLEQRLDDMDKATVVLHETVTKTPTEIQKQIGHLRELTFERFKSVDTQFENVKEATQLALTTQKESLAKAEENTKESQNKLESLLGTKTESLANSLTEVKTQVERLANLKLGGEQNLGKIYAAIAAVGAVLAILIVVANGVLRS